jgi:hypothetical protein
MRAHSADRKPGNDDNPFPFPDDMQPCPDLVRPGQIYPTSLRKGKEVSMCRLFSTGRAIWLAIRAITSVPDKLKSG